MPRRKEAYNEYLESERNNLSDEDNRRILNEIAEKELSLQQNINENESNNGENNGGAEGSTETVQPVASEPARGGTESGNAEGIRPEQETPLSEHGVLREEGKPEKGNSNNAHDGGVHLEGGSPEGGVEEYLASHPLTEEQIMADTEATEDEKLNAIDFLKGEDDSAISRFYYDSIYNRAQKNAVDKIKDIAQRGKKPATKPKEKSESKSEPQWQYNFHYDKATGHVSISREDVSGPIQIGDGRWHLNANSLAEMRAILENPKNNLGELLEEVGAELHNAEVGEQLRKRETDPMAAIETAAGQFREEQERKAQDQKEEKTASQREVSDEEFDDIMGQLDNIFNGGASMIDFFDDNWGKGEREDIGVEIDGKTTLEHLRELFDRFNTGEHSAELKALADKVFALVKHLNLEEITFSNDNEFTFGQQGLYATGFVRYRHNYFTHPDISKESKAHVLLHELVHACTLYAIRDYEKGGKHLSAGMKDAVKTLHDVYEQIKNDDSFKGEYGISDVKEMVAEMAKPTFRAQ